MFVELYDIYGKRFIANANFIQTMTFGDNTKGCSEDVPNIELLGCITIGSTNYYLSQESSNRLQGIMKELSSSQIYVYPGTLL